MRKTLIVNLLAGSGAGKSTNAARLFAMLKDLGIETELVTEYVKDMIWEGRTKIFECQPYIFGKQLYKLQRVCGNVDVIITDRPILLDIVYDPDQDEDFRKYVLKQHSKFNNLNVVLERVKPFSPNGRNEKCIEDAMMFDNKIYELLETSGERYMVVKGDDVGCVFILKEILKKIKELGEK